MTENKFLPSPKERTLKKTLSYMSGNILCKACDFLNGVMFIIYSMMLFLTEAVDGWLHAVLIGVGILFWGILCHFILMYIDENWRRYLNWMLFYSKEYCDYQDEAAFEAYVDASLRNHMIFRTRRLVLTKDCVLGTTDMYNGFQPVVILRKDVKSELFYEEEHWNWQNRRKIRTIDGVLELQMKDGNTIKLRVSEGRKNKIMRKLLT